eukprot:2547090-Prymnesium_polylepis.1
MITTSLLCSVRGNSVGSKRSPLTQSDEDESPGAASHRRSHSAALTLWRVRPGPYSRLPYSRLDEIYTSQLGGPVARQRASVAASATPLSSIRCAGEPL